MVYYLQIYMLLYLTSKESIWRSEVYFPTALK
jgi:hypothetical protein